MRNLLPKKSPAKKSNFYSQYPAHEPSVYQIVSLEIESDHTRITLTLFFLSELYNQHKLSVSEVRWDFVAFKFFKFHVSDTICHDFLNKKLKHYLQLPPITRFVLWTIFTRSTAILRKIAIAWNCIYSFVHSIFDD